MCGIKVLQVQVVVHMVPSIKRFTTICAPTHLDNFGTKRVVGLAMVGLQGIDGAIVTTLYSKKDIRTDSVNCKSGSARHAR